MQRRVKAAEEAVADQTPRLRNVEASVKDHESRVTAVEEFDKNNKDGQTIEAAVVSHYAYV